MFERILTIKGTFGGKFISVLLSIVLVLSMSNVLAFAQVGSALAVDGQGGDAPAAPAVENSPNPPTTPPAVENGPEEPSVEISPVESATVKIGGTLDLDATTTPAGANVEWSSSNELVATVDSTGTVTGVAAGNATITATVKITTSAGTEVTKTSTIDITVEPQAVVEPSVQIAPREGITVAKDDTVDLDATTTPAGANVTWSSDNAEVATVAAAADNANAGVVTGHAAGTAIITATVLTSDSKPITDSVNVTVTADEAEDDTETIGTNNTNGEFSPADLGTITATSGAIEGKGTVDEPYIVAPKTTVGLKYSGPTGSTPWQITPGTLLPREAQWDKKEVEGIAEFVSTYPLTLEPLNADVDASAEEKPSATVYISPDAPNDAQFIVRYDDNFSYFKVENNCKDATFYVRLSLGGTPAEPQSHSKSDYVQVGTVSQAIKPAEDLHYNPDGISVGEDSILSKEPTSGQINGALENKALQDGNGGTTTYDPNKHYVKWYVVKHEVDGWHVDGIVRSKESVENVVELTYDLGTTEANLVPGTMPEGGPLQKGAIVTVSDKKPERSDGYTFVCWVDDSGERYSLGASIEMNASKTLHAQWEKAYTVTFDKNGGSDPDPEAKQAKPGSSIVLPNYGGAKKASDGHVCDFIGWSENRDATGATQFMNAVIYPAGASYRVNSNARLYAVWAEESVDATFFVRLTLGIPPKEPARPPASEYSAGMKIENAIKVAEFCNSPQDIESLLNKKPDAEAIKKALEGKKITEGTEKKDYDPNVHDIIWYAIKHETDGWHVDGVVVNKGQATLLYEPNALDGVWLANTMPAGQPCDKGQPATINNEKTPQRNDGYEFVCWNTKKDGTGDSYKPGASITVFMNTTLYAQWKTKDNYSVRYDPEKGGSTAPAINSKLLAKGTDGVTGSEAIPNVGYKFSGWYKGTYWITDDKELTKETATDNLNMRSGEEDPNIYWDTVFTAKFIKDIAQTHKVSYVVNYYKDNECVEKDSNKGESSEGWIGDRATVDVVEEDINTADKYDGYEFDRVECDGDVVEADEIPQQFAVEEFAQSDDHVINVYYSKPDAEDESEQGKPADEEGADPTDDPNPESKPGPTKPTNPEPEDSDGSEQDEPDDPVPPITTTPTDTDTKPPATPQDTTQDSGTTQDPEQNPTTTPEDQTPDSDPTTDPEPAPAPTPEQTTTPGPAQTPEPTPVPAVTPELTPEIESNPSTGLTVVPESVPALTPTSVSAPSRGLAVTPGVVTATATPSSLTTVDIPINPLGGTPVPTNAAPQDTPESAIGDEGAPLAPPEPTTIEDGATPLAALMTQETPDGHVGCGVHFYIMLGIVLSVIYAAAVALRRAWFSRLLKGYEDDLTGDGGSSGSPAREKASYRPEAAALNGIPAMAAVPVNR